MENIPLITKKMFGSDYVPSEVPTLIDIGVVRPKGQGMETTCQKPKKIIWTQYKCGLVTNFDIKCLTSTP